MWRSSLMTRVIPKFNDNCHYKSQAEEDMTHDDRGRDRSDVATGQ